MRITFLIFLTFICSQLFAVDDTKVNYVLNNKWFWEYSWTEERTEIELASILPINYYTNISSWNDISCFSYLDNTIEYIFSKSSYDISYNSDKSILKFDYLNFEKKHSSKKYRANKYIDGADPLVGKWNRIDGSFMVEYQKLDKSEIDFFMQIWLIDNWEGKEGTFAFKEVSPGVFLSDDTFPGTQLKLTLISDPTYDSKKGIFVRSGGDENNALLVEPQYEAEDPKHRDGNHRNGELFSFKLYKAPPGFKSK